MNTLQAISNYKKRLLFAALWTYASLNYLYCDLMGFMDADMHLQYHTGQVDDFVFTPLFLVIAGLFMQIPIANVFLPFALKDNTLKWTQIVCGSVMSIVQTATLFAGKPSPYYAVFTALEVSATVFIVFYALRWKIAELKTTNGN